MIRSALGLELIDLFNFGLVPCVSIVSKVPLYFLFPWTLSGDSSTCTNAKAKVSATDMPLQSAVHRLSTGGTSIRIALFDISANI